MAATITVPTAELEVPSFNVADTELGQLRREVAQLRRELATLRDALAVEVRTKRLVVADGDRDVTIEPGDLSVHHRANGCSVGLTAGEEYASVDVTACDDPVKFTEPGVEQHVHLIAWAERDVEPGGPYCEVVVDGVELPRLTVADPVHDIIGRPHKK